MTMPVSPTIQTSQALQEEHILVVPRTKLFPHTAWHGINHADIDTYVATIQQHQMFIPRSLAENDPTYKQIIPYLVFAYQERLFVMQRRSDASEARLRNKLSLGIGGHIRQEDMQGKTIFDWAQREFHEEVQYAGAMNITPLGILNDDSNAVGQVHLGLVLLVDGQSDQISVRSELKSGRLYSLDECIMHKNAMESWSVLVLDFLLQNQAWSIQTP